MPGPIACRAFLVREKFFDVVVIQRSCCHVVSVLVMRDSLAVTQREHNARPLYDRCFICCDVSSVGTAKMRECMRRASASPYRLHEFEQLRSPAWLRSYLRQRRLIRGAPSSCVPFPCARAREWDALQD